RDLLARHRRARGGRPGPRPAGGPNGDDLDAAQGDRRTRSHDRAARRGVRLERPPRPCLPPRRTLERRRGPAAAARPAGPRHRTRRPHPCRRPRRRPRRRPTPRWRPKRMSTLYFLAPLVLIVAVILAMSVRILRE